MKNLLVVLPAAPYPLDSGGNIAVFEMINYLRGKIAISVILPESKSLPELKNLWPNVELIVYKKSFKTRINRKLSQLIYSLFIERYRKLLGSDKVDELASSTFFFEINRELIDLVQATVSNRKYDFVQVEFYELLPLMSFLNIDVPSIFVHHELRFIRNERSTASYNTTTWGNRFFTLQNKGQELEFLKLYDRVITVSDLDRDLLHAKYNSQPSIVSSPLAIKKHPANSLPGYQFQNILFFLGGGNHDPNYDALKWFLEECWPTILQSKPELQLHVIGAWEQTKIAAFGILNNVVFKGFVPELTTVFRDGILVVPMRVGSGMRMKIIDAVNFGIPFVTTTVGVEGLPFEHLSECYIGDSKSDFIGGVLELVDDINLQERFITNAKSKLEEDYSFDSLVKRRENIYY